MATRDIRTSNQDTVCDVCGRTLLRGEQAEVYMNGVARRSVCELCKNRALHEGWVREGTVPAYEEADSIADRRRSLFGRRRGRRETPPAQTAPTLRDELDNHLWEEANNPEAQAPPPTRAPDPAPDPMPAEPPRLPSRASRAARAARPGSGPGARERVRDRVREPRHVRAVPTSVEQKIISAVELFNDSEHRRTVAGVARSLGAPDVSVGPTDSRPSLVHIVVSWELCWYRYEVELSDDQPTVRVGDQGYELGELSPAERSPNAVADEEGTLRLGA